jgi:hypothetical protein
MLWSKVTAFSVDRSLYSYCLYFLTVLVGGEWDPNSHLPRGTHWHTPALHAPVNIFFFLYYSKCFHTWNHMVLKVASWGVDGYFNYIGFKLVVIVNLNLIFIFLRDTWILSSFKNLYRHKIIANYLWRCFMFDIAVRVSHVSGSEEIY